MNPLLSAVRNKIGLLTRSSAAALATPYSRVYLASDAANWVLTEEAKALCPVYASLGWDARLGDVKSSAAQAVHYMSQFAIHDPRIYGKNRIAVDYFHGVPGHEASLDRLFEAFCRRKNQIHAVRVSHSEIEALVKSTGYPASQIHRIPIGIRLDWFSPASPAERRQTRESLAIQADEFVVGSFQKDGVGWGDGSEPKLIKGPDHFVEVMRRVAPQIPRLRVLLTGPARGYVKAGLEKAKIPYTHLYPQHYRDIARLFGALDCYLVSSRQEGGPKAILESMASQTPLVTTRVGQAMDLVKHGQNGWMSEVGDIDGLAEGVLQIYQNPALRQRIKEMGPLTAKAESYEAQAPRWDQFLRQLMQKT